MNNLSKEHPFYFNATEKKIALGLFLVLWIFLFIRAIYVPVLHDELATFFYFVQSDNYLPPNAHWDANNHVFNSMLTNFSYHLFGSSPLALRLPNVLSYLLFFYAAFHIAGRLKDKLLRWGLLLAFVCSHYMFEYFGESRGYAMSMAFFAFALFQFFRLHDSGKTKHLIYTIVFLFIGTAANLTLIIPTVILFGYLTLQVFFNHFKTNRSLFYQQGGLLILLGLPFLFLVKFSFALKERGALYYGGDSGFYDITVSSVTHVFTGFYNLPIALFITLIFVGICTFVLIRLLQLSTIRILVKPTYLLPGLLFTSVVSILILSYGLKVNFPEDRAAMHLFILFIGSFAFILDDLGSINKSFTKAGIFLFYFPCLFLFHADPQGSVFSTEERTSFRIYDYISNSENTFKFPHLVGGYKTQEFCWYYLNHLHGGYEGKIHTNYHIALDADFQIVRQGKIEDSTRLFTYYEPVLDDPTTKLTLFERRKKLEKKLIYETQVVPTNGMIADEYHNILEMGIDSLVGKTLFIGAEMTLDAKHKPFESWLSCTVNDENGNSLYQEYIALDWIRKDWDGSENNLLQGTLLHDIPEGAKIIKFYIWNIDKTTFSIPDGKCYLYHLERDFPNQY